MTLHGVSIVDNRLFHHDIRGHENSVDEEASRRVDVMFNLLSTALSDIGPLGRCIIAPLQEMPLSKPMPCSDTQIEHIYSESTANFELDRVFRRP